MSGQPSRSCPWSRCPEGSSTGRHPHAPLPPPSRAPHHPRRRRRRAAPRPSAPRAGRRRRAVCSAESNRAGPPNQQPVAQGHELADLATDPHERRHLGLRLVLLELDSRAVDGEGRRVRPQLRRQLLLGDAPLGARRTRRLGRQLRRRRRRRPLLGQRLSWVLSADRRVGRQSRRRRRLVSRRRLGHRPRRLQLADARLDVRGGCQSPPVGRLATCVCGPSPAA